MPSVFSLGQSAAEKSWRPLVYVLMVCDSLISKLLFDRGKEKKNVMIWSLIILLRPLIKKKRKESWVEALFFFFTFGKYPVVPVIPFNCYYTYLMRNRVFLNELGAAASICFNKYIF